MLNKCITMPNKVSKRVSWLLVDNRTIFFNILNYQQQFYKKMIQEGKRGAQTIRLRKH